MAKLVKASDLKSVAHLGIAGSTPVAATNIYEEEINQMACLYTFVFILIFGCIIVIAGMELIYYPVSYWLSKARRQVAVWLHNC